MWRGPELLGLAPVPVRRGEANKGDALGTSARVELPGSAAPVVGGKLLPSGVEVGVMDSF